MAARTTRNRHRSGHHAPNRVAAAPRIALHSARSPSVAARPGGILRTHFRILLATLGLAGTACTGQAEIPAIAFWDELRTLCGRSFHGSPIEVSPLDSAVVGSALVVNVWQCWNEEVRIAFHVGDDHSRVWVLGWDEGNLTLDHSVHTADGESAEFSNYGGLATGPGSGNVQIFAPDAETLIRFPTAAGSTWTLELLPGERLTYAYDPGRPGEQFRIDFDLTSPAPRPPAPWGWTRSTRPRGPAR